MNFTVSKSIQNTNVTALIKASKSDIYIELIFPYKGLSLSGPHIPYFDIKYKYLSNNQLTQYGYQIAYELIESLFQVGKVLQEKGHEIKDILDSYHNEINNISPELLNDEKYKEEKLKAKNNFKKGNYNHDYYQNNILKKLKQLNNQYHLAIQEIRSLFAKVCQVKKLA